MFWQRFYDLCIQKGIKPNPLAQKIGISSGVISKWKNENTLPNGENLVKIADYLDVSVDYLLGRTDDPHFGQQKNELIALINQLTPAEQDKVITFYRLLKDEQTPPQQQ